MMDTEITLCLLSNIPKVTVDGREIHIPVSSLDLFIYLAVENQTNHDRDVLTRRLYESTAFRENLRKAALGNLNKEIKTVCILPSPLNLVRYDGSHVAVDVHEFSALATTVRDRDRINISDEIYQQWLTAYDLYQGHFLEDYSPALYGLNPWIQEQRRSLREMFHGLLEKLVQYEIAEGMYPQAQIHAERWHQSLPDAGLPLQYLIWLAANTDAHSDMLSYLHKLETSDSPDIRVIGHSPEEWRRLLEKGIKPNIRVLRLNDVAKVDVSSLIDIASDYIVGRSEALEDVFDTLFVEKSLLTVTGARGMGKTALAEAVATASLRMGMVERVIQVGVTSKTSFDQVMNAIVLHANQPHLADLDYRNKFVSVEQLLETEATLLILDQQETGDVFNDEFKMRVDAMSKPARVIVCSLDPWDDVHNVVLQPLDTVAVVDLFNTVAGVGLESESDITLLHTVTGGSPLAVTLFASSLNNRPPGLHDVLAQVNDEIIRVPSGLSHGAILSWCWGLLDDVTRRVLLAFMEFDPLEGPSPALLRELHPDLPEAVVQNVLRQLEAMRLIERRNGDGEQPVYRWHSLLHEFLTTIDTSEADAPHFRALVQERFFALHVDYLTRHREDYQLLDRQQHNLLHAFDLGFAQGRTTVTQVNTFLPYLIARGLYELANQIVESTLQSSPDRRTGDYIELLLNSVKMDMRRGEFQRAEQQINEAIALTADIDNRRHLGELYHQLGNVVRIQGQYEQAFHFLDMALQYARDAQDAKSICMILANMGVRAIDSGDYETAKLHLRESLTFAQAARQLRVIEFARTSLGVVAIEQFDPALALTYLKEAQGLARQIGSPERQAIVSLNASAAYYYQARYTDMRANLTNALEIAQKLQHEELIANIVRNLGRCDAAEGNLLVAEQHYKEALVVATDRGIKRLVVSVLLDLGKIGFQMHHKDYAYRCFYDALAQALAVGNDGLVAESLFGLGITSAAEAWIIGPDDAMQTIQVIQQSWDTDLLARLPSLSITADYFHKAEFFFQNGLINFPDIQRYRVADALAELMLSSEKMQ